MTSKPAPRRPANVPADATWDATTGDWDHGETKDGVAVGRWSHYRADGERYAESDFGDGTTQVTFRRFHPDGSIAQSGQKDLVKNVFTGVIRFTRVDTPSKENATFPTGVADELRAYEFHLDGDGRIVSRRGYDASGREVVIATGRPVPRRPRGVPADADPAADGEWTIWRCDFETQSIGDSKTWSAAGVLKKEATFEAGGDRVVTTYWNDGSPWKQTMYRNIVGTDDDFEARDETITFFNRAGKTLYTVRREQVADGHLRRHFDGALVFEAEWGKPRKRPRVRYFDLHGNVVLEYVPGKPGRGTWRLYDRAGKVELTQEETGEAERSRHGQWARYLPSWSSYSGRLIRDVDAWMDRDPDLVRASFRESVETARLELAIDAIKPSRALAAALRKIAWKKLSTMGGGQERLPRYVVGLMADDPAVSSHSANRLSFEIVDDQVDGGGGVHDSTYVVALVLAGMLPALAEPVATRVSAYLRELVALRWLPLADKKQYARLVRALDDAGFGGKSKAANRKDSKTTKKRPAPRKKPAPKKKKRS